MQPQNSTQANVIRDIWSDWIGTHPDPLSLPADSTEMGGWHKA